MLERESSRLETRSNPEYLSSTQDLYKILDTRSFLIDQINEVCRAKQRAWIQTMALEPCQFTNTLIQCLIDARNRGVDVRIVRDAYTDYVTANSFNHLPFLLNKTDRKNKRQILTGKDELVNFIEGNFQVRQTNIPTGVLKHTPFPGVSGRDHKKISIIDENVYIGGVNLTPLDVTRHDFMLKTNNRSIVLALSKIFLCSFNDLPISDSCEVCDDNNTILVDSGKASQSIVMQYVENLISAEEERVTIISPYLPINGLRNLLNQAVVRGVDVEAIISDDSHLGLAPKLSQLVHNTGQAKPLFRVTQYPGVLHAKAMLLGNHSAIIGSHNFDELFVYLGTEEVSLLTTQPEILHQLDIFRLKMKGD